MMKVVLVVLCIVAYLQPPVASGQTTLTPFLNPYQHFYCGANNPCAGGKLYTCSTGASCPGTPQANYADSAGTTPNANPIILDVNGSAIVWLSSLAYRFVLQDAAGVLQWSVDNVTWNTPRSTFSNVIDTGALTMQQRAVATPADNRGSSPFCLQGQYWTGSTSATDQWCFQGAAGSNPAENTTLTPSGSSGPATLQVVAGLAATQVPPLANKAYSLTTDTSGGVHTYAGIDTVKNPTANSAGCTDAGVFACYPMGNDLNIVSYGPADMPVANCAAEITSTTSVTAGRPTTITMTNPTVCGAAQAANPTSIISLPNGAAGLTICGPTSCDPLFDQAVETIPTSDYAIVSGFQLQIRATKTHSQPFKIRQQGIMRWQGNGVGMAADPTGGYRYFDFFDKQGLFTIGWPNDLRAKFPDNAIRLGAAITAITQSGSIILFQNVNDVGHLRLASDKGVTVFDVDNSGNTNVTGHLTVPAVLGPGFHQQRFTASGTFTIPVGITSVKVTVVAGGGAGGGGTAPDNAGDGGGSGGASTAILSSLTPGNTIVVRVGSGGTGVPGGPGRGGTGSSVASGTQAITTIMTNGGGGGYPANTSPGDAGAAGAGGDMNFGGQSGMLATGSLSGAGGPSLFGGGGLQVKGNSTGNAGAAPGAGGAGGGGTAGRTSGGPGAPGIVIFEWIS